MNILVIGGTRFFGVHMVSELLEKGHNITIATRGLAQDPFGDRVVRTVLDHTDFEGMKKALSGLHFDVAIDKVAYCSNDIKYAMDSISCDKYIYMSSTAVYELNHQDIKEDEFNGMSGKLKWCNRNDDSYSEVKKQAEYALWQKYNDKKWIAVSKWERGLGFPDINTIEYLADALDVSIIELMKSERETENVAIDEAVVVNVLDIAEKDVQKKQTRILIILLVTTFLCALVEMLQSIDWNARELAMSVTIPYTAIIPGFVTIIVSIIYKLKGEKTDNFIGVGICMMIIPFILSMGVFLVLGLLAG